IVIPRSTMIVIAGPLVYGIAVTRGCAAARIASSVDSIRQLSANGGTRTFARTRGFASEPRQRLMNGTDVRSCLPLSNHTTTPIHGISPSNHSGEAKVIPNIECQMSNVELVS